MDITATLQAKSDQLNALDLGGDMMITVTNVKIQNTDQPVIISFQGDNGKPWKPSLGMRRILAECWGKESNNWIGKSVVVYCDPSVKWAGKEAGGIRIRAMSDIKTSGHKTIIRESRQKTVPYFVEYLDMRRPTYPADQFEQAFTAMVDAMNSGKMTLQQVVSHCQKTGDLTPGQLKRLEDSAPKDEE